MKRTIGTIALLGAAGLLAGCASTSHRAHHDRSHAHAHAPDCGHVAVRHDGHVDYLHDGHLHHAHEGHADEHVFAVSNANPQACTPEVRDHQHGAECGHERVPHGDHHDYLVAGQLHSVHDGHCDDHGPVEVVN